MTLILLLLSALLVSLALGRLAELTGREVALQTLAMSAAALAFYGLVVLL